MAATPARIIAAGPRPASGGPWSRTGDTPPAARGMVQRPTDGVIPPELRPTVHPRLPGASRRRRQPRPRVRGGRRQAAVHRPRTGRAAVRRGRPELHRLRDVVGPADSRACAAGAHGGADPRRPARHELRRPDRARGGARGPGPPPGAFDRTGPLRQLGHRGDDERGAAGTGRDGEGPHRQVRGLLPRPRRRVPGPGRLGRDHARGPDQPRRPQGHGGGHPDRPLQRPRLRREAPPRPPRARRGGHRRAGRRQHGRRSARRGLPAGAAGRRATSTGRC